MRLLKFKIWLLGLMCIVNSIIAMLSFTFALISIGNLIKVIVFSFISVASITFSIVCYKAHEIEKNNMTELKERNQQELRESFKRMRESNKEEK